MVKATLPVIMANQTNKFLSSLLSTSDYLIAGFVSSRKLFLFADGCSDLLKDSCVITSIIHLAFIEVYKSNIEPSILYTLKQSSSELLMGMSLDMIYQELSTLFDMELVDNASFS